MRRFRRKEAGVPKQTELRIHLKYDDESKRWFVAHSDIPGLRLEADTPQELIQRIADAAPELIELNAAREEANTRPALSWTPVFDSPLELHSH